MNYSRDEKVVKISQEQFVPLINETESSNFYILYNFVTAQRSASDFWQPEKSEWHWIKNETDVVHDIEGNPEWMVFNLQQTGKRLFRNSIKFAFPKNIGWRSTQLPLKLRSILF